MPTYEFVYKPTSTAICLHCIVIDLIVCLEDDADFKQPVLKPPAPPAAGSEQESLVKEPREQKFQKTVDSKSDGSTVKQMPPLPYKGKCS